LRAASDTDPSRQPAQSAAGLSERVEVRVSYRARVGWALAFGVAFMLFSIVALVAYYVNAPGVESSSSSIRPFPAPILAFVVLGLCFLVIPLILSAEKQKIPRWIDPTGVTMRNGAHFPWHEYRGIRVLKERRASGTQAIEVGVELVFTRGTALIRYRPITNPADVLWITDQLKQGNPPFGG
jgi:hypothetical protein